MTCRDKVLGLLLMPEKRRGREARVEGRKRNSTENDNSRLRARGEHGAVAPSWRGSEWISFLCQLYP